MKKAEIKGLYFITHVDNVPSILAKGVLSHGAVEREQVPYTPIYDSEIVQNRKQKRTPSGQSLWEFANLYFQPRNPMLYRVICEKDRHSLAIISIRPDVMNLAGVLVTDGNAANQPTEFFHVAEGLTQIEKQWSVIQSDWWRTDDGSKRKIMAECLVPDRVFTDFVNTIYVVDHKAADQLRQKSGLGNTPIVPEPHMFFQPRRRWRVGSNISLVDGDMFFSDMHTLTVSVNLRGVMGKGLASRAKYQFPDVYVTYQDACRSRKLTATKPFLYKREASLDDELAEASSQRLRTPNAAKWFLLFATKRHWRDRSRIEDIDAGLNWLLDNYQQEGVRSLALPALGCGLGGLEWSDVGPVMCRYLSRMKIDTAIYLPREREIDAKYLGQEYLLSETEN